MSKRAYDGPALDLSYQHITERPALRSDGGESSASTESHSDGGDDQDDVTLEGEEDVVYATDPEPEGEERTENVPLPGPKRPDTEGQSTLEEWSR